AVQVKQGLSLNQIRVLHGESRPTDDELRKADAKKPLLYRYGERGGSPYRVHPLPVADGGLFLTVDLTGPKDKLIGYCAKKSGGLLDMTTGGHRIEDFWEPVFPDRYSRLILDPEQFYL